MKLTRSQRHKIYQEVKKSFLDEPEYLCILLKHWYRETLEKRKWLDNTEVKSLFPEFAIQEPKTSDGYIWFRALPHTKRGQLIRLKILNHCIRETKPKKAKGE